MAEAVANGLAARCALIPSIFILRSARALRFVDEKVPGIEVPAETDRARRGRRRPAGASASRSPASWPTTRARCPASPGCTSSRSARTPASPSSVNDWASRPEPKGTSSMETVLQSRSSTVTIGPEQPFCIIGERINPTGRKALRRGAAQRRPVDRDRRRRRPDRGRRRHARRQRGHPARRRGRAAAEDAAHRAGRHRPADLHRLVGHRGARGRARRSTRARRSSTRSPARTTASRRSCRSWPSTARPSSAWPTTRPASRRRRSSAWRSPRRSSRPPATTASRPRTSSSTRWP